MRPHPYDWLAPRQRLRIRRKVNVLVQTARAAGDAVPIGQTVAAAVHAAVHAIVVSVVPVWRRIGVVSAVAGVVRVARNRAIGDRFGGMGSA